ncbi:hypothetical protein SRHO_G00010470 [Serrasalmus rhombeus]
MDELRLWTTTQRWIRECNIMIVTESWLNGDIPDTAVELDGRSMFRADRVAEDSAAPEGTEQERELRPPPSPTTRGCWSNCFPNITLFN